MALAASSGGGTESASKPKQQQVELERQLRRRQYHAAYKRDCASVPAAGAAVAPEGAAHVSTSAAADWLVVQCRDWEAAAAALLSVAEHLKAAGAESGARPSGQGQGQVQVEASVSRLQREAAALSADLRHTLQGRLTNLLQAHVEAQASHQASRDAAAGAAPEFPVEAVTHCVRALLSLDSHWRPQLGQGDEESALHSVVKTFLQDHCLRYH